MQHASATDFVLSLLGPSPDGDGSSGPEHLDLDEPSWDEALLLIRYHMLEGLAVSRAGDVLPEGIQKELEPVHRRVGLQTTLMLESWDRARSKLQDVGIPALLYKGGALVKEGAYPEPGARRMDDVDVLVPADRASEAVDALRRGGFEPWTGWEPSKAGWADATALTDDASPPGMPLVVDLHWRADYGRLRFGDPAAEELLWEGADLERGVPAPAPHLVAVAEHLLKHIRFKVHLVGFADLGLLTGEIEDWDRVVALLRGRRLSRAVGALLESCRQELGHPAPGGVARALGARGPFSRLVRRRLAPSALLGRRRPVDGRFRGILFRWLLAGTPGRAARDLADAAFPNRRWLLARYGDGGAASAASGEGEGPGRDPEAARWPGPWKTLRLWRRYAADVVGWLTYRRRSPASPHESLFDPREPT